MEQNELKKKFASGDLSGWYIFCGDEDYLKRHWVTEFRRVLAADPDLSVFNHICYEGAKFDLPALSEAIKSPPFMEDRKLIEWDNIELDRLTERDVSALSELAELKNECNWTTLIISCPGENFDVGQLSRGRPSKLYKQLSEIFDIVCFDRATDSQLISWLGRRFAASSVSVTPDICRAMLECSGHSMEVLADEAEKLCCFALSRGESAIHPEWVGLVCSHSFEGDAFGLSNAIMEGNAKKAFTYLLDMKRRRVKPFIICDSIARHYGELLSVSMLHGEGMTKPEIAKKTRLHEYKVGLYIKSLSHTSPEKAAENLRLISEFDIASKSGGQSGYSALEVLVTACM